MVRNLLAVVMVAVLSGYARFKELLAEVVYRLAQAAPRSAAGPAIAIALDEIERAFAMDNRGQLGLGTILAAFAVVIAAFVVLIVVDQFDASLGTPSSGSLSTAQNDILTGFGDMASLIQPLLLIAIGVVIIGLIRRIQ